MVFEVAYSEFHSFSFNRIRVFPIPSEKSNLSGNFVRNYYFFCQTRDAYFEFLCFEHAKIIISPNSSEILNKPGIYWFVPFFILNYYKSFQVCLFRISWFYTIQVFIFSLNRGKSEFTCELFLFVFFILIHINVLKLSLIK